MRIPWLPPAARNSLSSSCHNEPDLPMGIRTKLFAAFFAIACFGSIPSWAENPVREKQDRFSLAVECIKRFEGWHSSRHYPYVGWGHCLQPGEKYSAHTMTRQQADELLRKDLRKFCAMFRQFGKDSLLLATLAYNVGPYRLLGSKKIPKSSLVKKLEAGDRNIYKEYVSFRCYKGKVVPSIERRRKVEYLLLFEE